MKSNHISTKCQAATMKLFFFKSKVNGVTKALIWAEGIKKMLHQNNMQALNYLWHFHGLFKSHIFLATSFQVEVYYY